jgi:sulfatase maturation enzyme AslB (radical SAM superfamily)
VNDLIINPTTFCATPFVDVRINPNGSMHFCYVSGSHSKPGDNIQLMTVDEFFNKSSTVMDVRNRMTTGQAHHVCEGCYKCEQSGNVSYRQKRNINFAIFPQDDFVPSVTESPLWSQNLTKPRYYHVSFSNLCNMACMMCFPGCSSLLTSTLKKIDLIPADTPILQDWTQGPAWSQFCDHLINNNQIFFFHIMGGEPMYHKKFKELLIMLNDKKHTNFHFSFVTNGSVYDPEVAELLKSFRSVAIEISLEHPGQINTYVRHYSDTDTVLHNIDQWIQHKSSTFDIVLRPLPQALTVLHYDQLLNFAVDRELTVDSHLLDNPDYLRANILPDDIKHIVRQKIQTQFLKTQTWSTQNINHRNSSTVNSIEVDAARVLNQLDVVCDNVEQKRQQFVDYCAKFDRSRGMHIRDYVPELVDFMNQYGYENKLS